MPKATGGRPKKGEEDRPTKNVRMYADIADMITEIVEVANIRGEKLTAAKLLDPLVRKSIQKRHTDDLPAIAKLRAARADIMAEDGEG